MAPVAAGLKLPAGTGLGSLTLGAWVGPGSARRPGRVRAGGRRPSAPVLRRLNHPPTVPPAARPLCLSSACAYWRIATVRCRVRLFARSGITGDFWAAVALAAGSGALVKRLPGPWVLLGVCAAAVAAGVGLAVSGGPSLWSPGGRALPPARARVYENVDACLLTGAGPEAHRRAGLGEDGVPRPPLGVDPAAAVRATVAAARTGAASGDAARTGVQGHRRGRRDRAAALAEADRFSSVRFVVTGPAAGSPGNVTALAFMPSGLEASVASAVEAGVRAAGGDAWVVLTVLGPAASPSGPDVVRCRANTLILVKISGCQISLL